MPIAKTYKRYAPLESFGVVGSIRSCCLLVDHLPGRDGSSKNSKKNSQYVITAALENVIVWDVRRGEKIAVLRGTKHEVTMITKNSSSKMLAVGYNDGSIKLWNLKRMSSDVTLSGHKSAVTSLAFDSNGTKLVSGSRDTDVIVWDVLSECGLYRLKGHKGPITCCYFMKEKNVLITSSKDTFVKFWDLDTEHCFLTLVGHRSEVWQFCVISNDTRLITGSGDSELRVWKISPNLKDLQSNGKDIGSKRSHTESTLSDDETETSADTGPLTCTLISSTMRQSRERLVCMKTDPTGRYIACHGNDSMLEIFKISSPEEIAHSMKRRLKKLRKLQKDKPESEQNVEVSVEQTLEDELVKIQAFQLKQKLRSCDLLLDSNNCIKVMLLHNNNSLSFCKIDPSQSPLKCLPISSICKPGHRTDVRTLAFNSDATCVLSGSGDGAKIWNRSTQVCIRTLESDYCLNSFFVPGDRHVVIATKSGKIQLFDISAGVLLESIEAHEGAVWGLSLAPDKKGFATGSADHEVKFWEFELMDDAQFSTVSKRLSMTHVKTLKMSEEVLAVQYSPDQRLFAVSLLDCTVKVFFSDTLKFFLSLYGHKFPVLCLDISQDNSLLVTGSADKNIKLWGLDFGDCHKSIFAHDDSITSVKFVAKTHYFFSVSKDKTLKYWDADKFENIMSLQGHHAEIWSLAVSNGGEFVVTGSHDKSIRLWQRTEELLVIDEEREQEREAAYEESLAEGGEPVVAGEADENEAAFAGKKTIETVKAAERLMEAIHLYKEEEEKMSVFKETCEKSGTVGPLPEVHPILKAHGNIEPVKYVLQVLKKIRSSELEESLLVLPFSNVMDLLQLINLWMQNTWEVELTSRCLFFLLRIHHGQITSNEVLLTTIESIKDNSRSCIQELKDQVGFNLAGLRYIQSELELKNVSFFGDAKEILKKKKKKQKTMLAFT